jgi:CheY-like chemotaxis protein
VVEDEPSDRAWLVRLLATAGYDVEAARSSRSALELCRERRFDAITVELLLPDLNGLDLLRMIRTGGGPNRDAPVIVVTIVAESISSELPVHDYLTKPLTGDELLASLARAGVGAVEDRLALAVHLDPATVGLVRAALEPAGYRIVFAATGEEALCLTAGPPPAIVVLDPSMVGPEAFSLLENLRRRGPSFETVVIVWKAGGMDDGDCRRLASLARNTAVKAHGGGTAALIEELRHRLHEVRPAHPTSGGG